MIWQGESGWQEPSKQKTGTQDLVTDSVRGVEVANNGHFVFRMVYEVLKCGWKRTAAEVKNSLRKMEMEVLYL